MNQQLTAIALFILVPCILSFFNKEKDQLAIYLLASLSLIAIYFALYPLVGQFKDWFPWYGFFNKFLSVAVLTITIILSYRLKNKYLAGMMCAAAGLILLSTFHIHLR